MIMVRNIGFFLLTLLFTQNVFTQDVSGVHDVQSGTESNEYNIKTGEEINPQQSHKTSNIPDNIENPTKENVIQDFINIISFRLKSIPSMYLLHSSHSP